MSTKTKCPQSKLSGFPPKPETAQDWIDKLTANGITDGVLCRLIHGRDEGKIVKFENYTVNDLGVCIDGGYFLLQDETLKVAEPLFVSLLELSEDVRFFGGVANGKKLACFRDTFKLKITEIDQKGSRTTYKDHDIILNDGAKLYQFRTAQDLFAWMALND